MPPKPILTIHPQAQVVVSGRPLDKDQAREVIAWSREHLTSLGQWCGEDGTIGHLDSVLPGTTFEKLYGELLELTLRFWFLNLGVTIMTGPPGTLTKPLISYLVERCSIKQSTQPHFGHPAPRRVGAKSVLPPPDKSK